MKDSPPLLFIFTLALTSFLFMPIFFPHFRFIAFAPFLCVVFMRKPFSNALWVSGLTGLLIDLVSSQMRFGLWTLNHTITVFVTYRLKRHFFEDNIPAFCFYSAVIATVSSTFQLLLMTQFSSFVFSFKTVLIDCLFLSVFDAFYALLWFICPMKFYSFIKRIGFKRLFNLRRS